ncbi:MAG TPA: DUF4390 domain-containing protein [Deltaproteobacteria bacterium]|nr:DUF4390 domain-containing protein [Deltaproteobacteria bacterium]
MKDIVKLMCIPFFVLLFMVMFDTDAQAKEPGMTDILVTNNEESVLFYARLVNGFKEEMEKAIHAGVPAEFIMKLHVYEQRSYIWDKKINSKVIVRTISYDNLKKTFSIYSNDKKEPAVFNEFQSAKSAMADFNGIVAMPIAALEKGKTYYLKAKVIMDKVRLPLGMESISFFVSLWDYDTKWHTKEFILK